MVSFDRCSVPLLRTIVALAGLFLLTASSLQAQSGEAAGPLIAHVGTFSSPLRDVLPSQVDLPPGFTGSNFCSEILVSADGQFVHAGNRLHDSIGIFSVGSHGELTFKGEVWTHGNYARSFHFDPTGQFLYWCNQRADNIAVFRAHRGSGALEFTGQYVPVGNPSAIVFLDRAQGG